MANYKDIFSLVQSLGKGERRNLHILANQWGRQPLHLQVLEELYRMESLDMDRLRQKFTSDDRVIQRSIRKILEVILQTRSIFEPGPRETIAREIADIRFLLEKGASGLALDQIDKSLAGCQQRELFEEQSQLLLIKRRLTGNIRQADEEIGKIDILHRNLISYLSLRERIKADLEDNRTGKNILCIRSILADELLLHAKSAISVKAEFQRLSIRFRIHNYLREYESMIQDLEQLRTLLQANAEILDETGSELLEHSFILANVYIHRMQGDRARALMHSIEQMELFAADLIARRFENYSLTQLGFACDFGDASAGNAVLNLIDRNFNRYANSISPLMQRLLLFMSAKYLFYRGDFEQADQYICKIMAMAAVDQFKEFVPFAKAIQLLCAYEIGSFDEIENKTRSLQRILASHDTQQVIPARILQMVKDCMRQVKNARPRILNDFFQGKDSIAASEFHYFDFDLYLEAKLSTTDMLSLAEKRVNTQAIHGRPAQLG
ncbi:MAG TPA: hypothetical protein ENJ82_12800 [Bacteroidetes bacterium]|nr:hypothetical protein [Bacteroidota bacterium]